MKDVVVFALSVVLFALLVHGQNTPNLPYNLDIVSHFPYKVYQGTGECDVSKEPCALLNDIWGYEYKRDDGVMDYFAIVGLANGFDVVNVTDSANPQRVKFFPGCLNNWRDMKVFGKHIYGITEYTRTCDCAREDGMCGTKLRVVTPDLGEMEFTSGRLTPPVPTNTSLELPVAAFLDASEKGCRAYQFDLTGKAIMVRMGDCSIRDKVLFAQDAGAEAVLFVSESDDITFPGMTGTPVGVNIPAVMIAKSNADKMFNAIANNDDVTVDLQAIPFKSALYSPPEGLTIIDMSEPAEPKVSNDLTHFAFAHNVYIEERSNGDAYMYVVGMSDERSDQNAFGDIENGGILAFRLDPNDPKNPELVATFNETYIHDVSSHVCGNNRVMLFGAGIYTDEVFVWDVTTITPGSRLVPTTSWPGQLKMSHNVWPSETCDYLYVTHELVHAPITVWQMQRNPVSEELNFDVPGMFRGSLAINEFAGTLPHNVFVKGDVLWASYYTEGVATWNITAPSTPTLMGHQDTSELTNGFGGVWGVYPYATTNIAYASDRENGLFLLRETVNENYQPDLNGSSGGDDYPTAVVAIGWTLAGLFLIATLLLIVVVVVLVVMLSASSIKLVYDKLRNRSDDYEEVGIDSVASHLLPSSN